MVGHVTWAFIAMVGYSFVFLSVVLDEPITGRKLLGIGFACLSVILIAS